MVLEAWKVGTLPTFDIQDTVTSFSDWGEEGKTLLGSHPREYIDELVVLFLRTLFFKVSGHVKVRIKKNILEIIDVQINASGLYFLSVVAPTPPSPAFSFIADLVR